MNALKKVRECDICQEGSVQGPVIENDYVWTSLMGFVLVWVSLEVEPETRIHMQFALKANPRNMEGRAREEGKGRHPIRLVLSSESPLWAPVDFRKWCITHLSVIPYLYPRDMGC